MYTHAYGHVIEKRPIWFSFLALFFCMVFMYDRQFALANARVSPIFEPRSWQEDCVIHYPNVYDALAEARKKSSYIGGSKVGLQCAPLCCLCCPFFLLILLLL